MGDFRFFTKDKEQRIAVLNFLTTKNYFWHGSKHYANGEIVERVYPFEDFKQMSMLTPTNSTIGYIFGSGAGEIVSLQKLYELVNGGVDETAK